LLAMLTARGITVAGTAHARHRYPTATGEYSDVQKQPIELAPLSLATIAAPLEGRRVLASHVSVPVAEDLMVTAKSLGGGLPLGAVTGKAEIMDHTVPGSLGGTFGGNPLACEAALASLDAIEDGKLCERAACLGKQFQRRALAWKERFPIISDVRGLGAMQAFELASADFTKALTKHCYEHGLILVTSGTYSNVVRILMPLVVTDDQMNEALGVMETALEEVA